MESRHAAVGAGPGGDERVAGDHIGLRGGCGFRAGRAAGGQQQGHTGGGHRRKQGTHDGVLPGVGIQSLEDVNSLRRYQNINATEANSCRDAATWRSSGK